MSGVLDNIEYELPIIPFGGYKVTKVMPKVRLRTPAGYIQQREQSPTVQYKIQIEFEMLTDAEKNLLAAFIDEYKSETFYFIFPTSMKPKPDGKIYPIGILCLITSDEMAEDPKHPGFLWTCSLTFESMGSEVVGTPPTD
ncbi:MAG TPA: hypothetical protein DDW17_02180 [Deltaproteobacteria bacterium]|nr:hypothetical protein [Deltaproteobacteria bacterium]